MSLNSWMHRSLSLSLAAWLCACTTVAPAPTGTAFEQDVAAATDALAAQWHDKHGRPGWLARWSPTTVAMGPFVNLPASSPSPSPSSSGKAGTTPTASSFAQPQSIASARAREVATQRLDSAAPELKRVSVDQAPALLLSASLAPETAAAAGGTRQLLTLVLEDNQSHVIVARWQAPVRAAAADLFPGRYSGDSPVIFTQPNAVSNEALFGKSVDAAVPAQEHADRAQLALLEDARSAYEHNDYERALQLFQAAAAQPSALSIRAYNGQYLSLRALKREAEANTAFKHVIEEGFRARALAIKLLFTPGLTTFWADPAISGAYQVWIRDLSAQAAASPACLSIVGHTSRTGTEGFNQSLSLARSQYVASLLQADHPELAARLYAAGKGWAENIVGSGSDDARDAIDRRVEFKIVDCGAAR